MFCCSHQKSQTNTMNSSGNNKIARAIQKADNILTEEGYDLDILKREISETNNNYEISYSLKDPSMLGGGAKIIFSKKDLKVIKKEFSQ